MPLGPKDVLLGVVLPAIASAVVMWLLGRFGTTGFRSRLAAPIALAIGFCAGYALLGLGPLRPDRHWHWLPYVVLTAAAAAPIGRVRHLLSVERVLLFAGVASATMWLLVPNWDDLSPPRPVQMALWGAVVAASALSLEPLAARLSGPSIPAQLVVVMTCGGIVLALSGSLRFAQIAGAGIGALSGMLLVAWLDRSRSLPGVALPFAVLIGGMMLIGRVNSFSSVPLASYLMIPLATTMLWLGASGPLSKCTGMRLRIVQSMPVLVSAIAVIVSVIAEVTSGE